MDFEVSSPQTKRATVLAIIIIIISRQSFIVFFLSSTLNTFSHPSLSQEDPELYFTDPQQLLDLVTELTEQNLSLYHISTRVEDTLKDLQQSIESTKQNM